MSNFFRRSMMARLAALAAVALVTGGAQFRCSSDEGGEGPTFATSLVLRDAAGVPATVFEAGEVVTMQLTVRNRSRQAVELDFASGQQYEFFIFRSGANSPSWVWSSQALFTQAASTLVFPPGESRIFTVNWTADLPRGSYEARGALLFDELRANPLAPHELGSTLAGFTVN